jgi:hypothetical protein
MFDLPVFAALERAETILLAGAGGGFDIFTGLPLYFALRKAGKRVYLANLSFSMLYATDARKLAPSLVEVTAETENYLRYFPEQHLARWLRKQGEPDSIYCFERVGARPITAAYAHLADRLGLDAVALVDGGTDSLMRGDEPGLGTPEEDMVSLAAVQALTLPTKLLVCLGFGIDTFHGVCHAYFLEAVAELARQNAFLGSWSLHPQMREVELYRSACDFAFRAMFNHPSIVNASILSAIDGHFGDHHATHRTQGSELFINPLMTLYWAFQADAVAARCLYLDRLRNTETRQEVFDAIYAFREEQETARPWKQLPV